VLAFCVLTWGLLCGVVFWRCRRPQMDSVGLPLAYVALLSVGHCGAALELLPWFDPSRDPYLAQVGITRADTIAGFAASTLGLGAFCLGSWFLDGLPYVRRARRRGAAVPVRSGGRNLVLIGVLSYFVLSRARWIPGSITSAGGNLAVVGLCLLAGSWRRRGIASRSRLIVGALSFPLITAASAGFIGFGVTALVQAGSFFVRVVRLRWWSLAVAPVLVWLGLSVYVTYMAARNDIRKQVWGGSGLTRRVETFARVFAGAQLFDPWNAEHLYAIAGRLNQNGLVGRAIRFMEQEKTEPAYGETLAIAAVAWIPRVLWPGKPVFGGSGNLVSKYTGMTFDKDTAVGVGNVLESYINFGMAGIGLGFFVFGAIVRHLDFRAGAALRCGRTWDYVFYHLVGISALQPGNTWAEAVGSCAAAAVLVAVLKRAGIQA